MMFVGRLRLALVLVLGTWAAHPLSGTKTVCAAPQASPSPLPVANSECGEDEPCLAPVDRGGWIAVPVLGYTPETSVQLGGLVIRFFDLDPDSSLSSVPVLLIGTFKEQVQLEVRPEMFFDENNYWIWTRFDLQRYPDVFFGVGSDTRTEDREPYQRSFFRARSNLRRRIVGDLYAGILSDHMLLKLDVQRTNGLFATKDYVGEAGGTTAAIGPTLAYDSRDHNHYPTRGLLVDAAVTPFTRFLGSDYSFLRFTFDARAYVSTYPGQLIAFRYLMDATGSGAPFYLLPQLGGPDILRGYFRGRYRDTTAEVFEAEYRAQLFWRLSGVLFSGVGHVGPSYGEMWGSQLRPSFGTGLRYNMKKPDDIVNFRVDLGMWPWTSDFGLYVAAVEAF